ncbi:PfWMP4_25 [Phormidium phage Pf-WMP4]|uniref:PfWMP4_25 n=1 Tax=Phormidium phage Pf-WMP4 TaxID=2913979 RepID=Q0GBU1_9CAUD|nr:PfWMP4_25 [Phormidium phage Pf-WMP4]ABI33169.1 PfWMP4_25 [Phormidium phage Pf-WMP4]
MTLKLQALTDALEKSGALQCDREFSKRVQARLAQAAGHPDDPTVKYRASSIGKPWITQTLDKWYGGAKIFTVSQTMTMLQGMLSQEYIAELLNLMDYKFSQEVTVKYKTVMGHADIIVEDDSEIIVLECKSMAPHLINPFIASPSDDYGYLSQLSFYWWCAAQANPSKKASAAFVLYDRGNSRIKTVSITPSAMQRKVERIQTAVDILSRIEPYDVDTLLREVVIPPTVDGKIMGGIARTRWARLLYAPIETGDGVVYRVQDLDVIAQQLKNMPQHRRDDEEVEF